MYDAGFHEPIKNSTSRAHDDTLSRRIAFMAIDEVNAFYLH